MHICIFEAISRIEDTLKGLSWNEISRRYVDYEPEYYMPQSWRLRAEDKKQGSSDETIQYDIIFVLGKYNKNC